MNQAIFAIELYDVSAAFGTDLHRLHTLMTILAGELELWQANLYRRCDGTSHFPRTQVRTARMLIYHWAEQIANTTSTSWCTNGPLNYNNAAVVQIATPTVTVGKASSTCSVSSIVLLRPA
jgi:hypothetical protein